MKTTTYSLAPIGVIFVRQGAEGLFVGGHIAENSDIFGLAGLRAPRHAGH